MKSNSLKYIVLNHFQVPQAALEDTFEKFSRKRDYYRTATRNVSPCAPSYIPFKAISGFFNVSVISSTNFENENIPTKEYANIYPVVWTYPGAPYTLQNIMDFNANSEVSLRIVPIPIFDFNFVYCDTPVHGKNLK